MMRLHATVYKSTSSSARLSFQELSLCCQYVTERSLEHPVISIFTNIHTHNLSPVHTETNKGNLGTKANEPKSRRVRLDLKLTNRRMEHRFNGGKLSQLSSCAKCKTSQTKAMQPSFGHSYLFPCSVYSGVCFYKFVLWRVICHHSAL